MLGGVGNYSMDSKGIKQLHKQVEELHTESRVASGSEQRETKCAIPPRVCVIVLFLSNPCCSYIIFLPYFQANRSHGHFVFNTFFQNLFIFLELLHPGAKGSRDR